jgi:hypothetical protein
MRVKVSDTENMERKDGSPIENAEARATDLKQRIGMITDLAKQPGKANRASQDSRVSTNLVEFRLESSKPCISMKIRHIGLLELELPPQVMESVSPRTSP